ncbi:MAG: hypothetical protein COV99_00985 [Bacteroidetes bacterium CG12_big_fil_rev_8_21_14_0_65_60_17]|nr:MAG: hypothetical protein COV99_00985 [Bacteroidetes bacterium CG12_big_fil_rev_8_21_14_0_65_60_17]
MSSHGYAGARPLAAALIPVMVLSLVWSACDATDAGSRSSLIVEAFVQAGPILPEVRVRQTSGRESGREAAVVGLADAVVAVRVGDTSYAYRHIGAGRYASILPAKSPVVEGDPFQVDVERDGVRATGSGTVPPDIVISGVEPIPARTAVEAILVDSLGLSIDSLDVGLGARLGFIVPVEVQITWDALEDTYWVATSLDPEESFSSSVLDFFLLPSEVIPEGGRGTASWKGVYAVPVEDSTSSLPRHSLLVSITRGDAAFAAWMNTQSSGMASANAGNVEGAIGFVGGVAIDTVQLRVGN